MHMRSLLLSHSLSLYHYRLYAFCRLLFVGLKLFFFFFFFDKESAFKKNYHMWEKDEEEASVSINSSHQFFFFLFLSKPRRANTILRSFKPIFYAFYTFLFFFSTKRYLTRHQLCFRKYRFFETLSLSFPFFSFLLSLPTNVSLSFFSPERRQERHHFPTTFNNVACSPRLSPPPNLINRSLK